jgi:hypothetical protein
VPVTGSVTDPVVTARLAFSVIGTFTVFPLFVNRSRKFVPFGIALIYDEIELAARTDNPPV